MPWTPTQGNLPSPVARGTENIESENESESKHLEVQSEIAVMTEPTELVARWGGTQKTAKNKAKKPKVRYTRTCDSVKMGTQIKCSY